MKFEDASFDIVIDKGTLDSILVLHPISNTNSSLKVVL